jgi:hypothetical protein
LKNEKDLLGFVNGTLTFCRNLITKNCTFLGIKICEMTSTWAEIHQVVLSMFSLLAEFFIVKMSVKDKLADF